MPRISSAPQKGFTLAEVMVGIALFAVIAAIALTLYQQLQKSFKQGENAAFQQQNTRIAFDRMVADLRMLGFNYNPDGDGGRPDEQIEGMWKNAITVRGDFDYETADANTPENTLGGSGMPFGIVSIGNDEIVTYALGKPSGSGGSTITFQADVSAVPRDGTVETVQINNVYVDMNSPPYTLYRIHLKPGGTALSSIANKVPIADDIRSLEFTYYDGAGAEITTMAGGMDDPNSLAARKKIARISIGVVGMTKDPDLAYFDPADSNPASRNYRKFELSGDVSPRNLGFVGQPDLDLQDPSTPTGLAACPGHCEALWTTWNPNPSNEGVVKYEVTSGPTYLAQGGAQDTFTTNLYLDGLTTGSSYVVGVGAVDAAGNTSDPRAFSTLTAVADATTPAAPTSFVGTSIGAGNALASQIDLTWAKPTQNINGMACDAIPAPLRDLEGYQMYRGAAAGFDPNDPAQVQASWDPSQVTAGASSLSDKSVVNCRTYYYQAQAEDECGNPSAMVTGSGSASTGTLPSAPVNLIAMDMGLGSALLTWDPVVTDTGSPQGTILIDSYRVYRASVPTASDPNQASYALLYDGPVASVGAPAYGDTNIPTPPMGEDYYYRISARDDCPNESALSTPALLYPCSFGGTVSIVLSPGGSYLTGPQSIAVSVSGGVATTSATVRISDANVGTTVYNHTVSGPGPYSFPTWDTSSLSGNYVIVAAVTNSAGCTGIASLGAHVYGGLGACLVPTSHSALALVSGRKNSQLNYTITNQCGFDVEVTNLLMAWANRVCPSKLTNPLLESWLYQGFSPIDLVSLLGSGHYPLGSGFTPEAMFDLTFSPFSTTYLLPDRASMDVSYVFSSAMLASCKGVITGNTFGVEYTYRRVPATGPGSTGATVIIVDPDPLSPGIALCDPIDPNCPLF